MLKKQNVEKITTILSIAVSAVLIVFVGIGPDKLGNFWDLESVAIVIGGAVCAVVASYPLSTLAWIPRIMALLIQGNRYNIGFL